MAATLAVSLCACDRPAELLPTAQDLRNSHQQSSPQLGTDPDEAWRLLATCSPDTVIPPGDRSLESFMRHIELSRVMLRDRGLSFWREFPGDERKFRWLLQTTLMPPAYPVDIETWAAEEASLAGNVVPLDRAKIDRWESTYVELRNEFWQSKSVSNKERRLLWMGEIQHQLRIVENSILRDEEVVVADLASEILEFAAAYPRPYGETDRLEFYWIFETVATGVLYDLRDVQGWTRDEKRLFAQNLLDSANEAAGNVARRFLDTTPIFGDTSTPWELLPRYPRSQTDSTDGMIAFFFDRAVSTKKFRSIGLRLWNDYPQFADRLNWFVSTHWTAPLYTECVPSAIRQEAEGNGHLAVLDVVALDDWKRVAANLSMELERDPLMDDTLLAQVYSSLIWADVWNAQRRWQNSRDEHAVMELLEDLRTLYEKFEDVDTVHKVSGVILREPRKFGLTDTDLLAFFEPMKDLDAPELQRFADSVRARIELHAEPFDFEAPSLSGDIVRASDLRGNIVLIDHWATTCASCIGAMPRINNVRDQYHDRGFEVLSIAYDGTSQRKLVERIKSELGLTWITLDGEGQWEEVAEKYGYQGFPQYMLLNRDGTLYAGTGEVDMGRNLEALLNEMLVVEAAAKESATIH